MAEVLVLVEQNEGKVVKSSLEAVVAAAKLGTPAAVIVDKPGTVEKVSADLAKVGVEKIYKAEADSVAEYFLTPKVDVLVDLIEKKSPVAVLISASIEGKELAGRLAAKVGASLLSDVIDVAADGSVVHSIFGGTFNVTAKSVTEIAIITIRPGAIAIEDKPASISVEDVAIPEISENAVKIVGFEPAVRGDRPDLTAANIVVSGGRGVGSAEKFKSVIEPLADSLGAAVGASRAAVDSGYYPGQFQVGQTGKTVSPQLYVALGISGAIQHKAGMQTSKTVISVNKDEEAPIFEITDFGIIGDLFEVAPQLTEAINKHKGK